MNAELKFSNVKPHLLFYVNVENAPEIRSQVMKAELPCAVLNPRFVLDSFQVMIATQIAVNNQQSQLMKTRSVYSEIIYNMSPNKKISDSLKSFGMSDTDKEILCVVLDDESRKLVQTTIKGELRDITEIHSRKLPDEKEIKKIYKIKEEELSVGTLLEAVINRISTKELVTF